MLNVKNCCLFRVLLPSNPSSGCISVLEVNSKISVWFNWRTWPHKPKWDCCNLYVFSWLLMFISIILESIVWSLQFWFASGRSQGFRGGEVGGTSWRKHGLPCVEVNDKAWGLQAGHLLVANSERCVLKACPVRLRYYFHLEQLGPYSVRWCDLFCFIDPKGLLTQAGFSGQHQGREADSLLLWYQTLIKQLNVFELTFFSNLFDWFFHT